MVRSAAVVLPQLIGAAALLLLLAAPSTSRAAWTQVPGDDVHGGDVVIKQVAQFAVLVYGLAHRRDMAYVDVVRGETQQAVGGGTNYKLLVVAANNNDKQAGDGDGETAEYECLVWGVPGSRSDTWKLRRFRKIHA